MASAKCWRTWGDEVWVVRGNRFRIECGKTAAARSFRPSMELIEMSTPNPYSPTSTQAIDHSGIRKVRVRPFALLRRASVQMGDQYLMFVAITFVGTFIASMVPFGLVAGAMAVGVYLCYLRLERGERVDFATLFRGFDYFMESLIAFLIYFVISVVVMIPFLIAIFAIVLGPVLAGAANPGNAPPPLRQTMLAAILILYPLMILANLAVALPFLFTFQLIADRNYRAIDSVRTSIRGVVKNLGGVIWFAIVTGFIASITSMMCFLPVILFMPLLFGSMFLLYRDVFTTELPNSNMP